MLAGVDFLKLFYRMEKYRCTVCEYIYDPESGDPENGIDPGTAFEDLPTIGYARSVTRANGHSNRSKQTKTGWL